IILIFYIDDFLVFFYKSNAIAAERVIEGIKARYNVYKQGDISWFLGIRVIRDRPIYKI
ncbi:hypothetical protein L209DRAFT_690885, partial [Thermothelomyces heterothallicus CBS 203.75]